MIHPLTLLYICDFLLLLIFSCIFLFSSTFTFLFSEHFFFFRVFNLFHLLFLRVCFPALHSLPLLLNTCLIHTYLPCRRNCLYHSYVHFSLKVTSLLILEFIPQNLRKFHSFLSLSHNFIFILFFV